MQTTLRLLWILFLTASCGGSPPGGDASESAEPNETPMARQARGTFDVDLTPRSLEAPTFQEGAASMSLTKVLRGDLEGTSVGEMLAVRSDVDGSAGYVAMEMVTGSLHGRSGTFWLQHSSTMDRNAPTQSITVVPDSGTGDLDGLRGDFTISIVEGQHFYEFDYTLPGG